MTNESEVLGFADKVNRLLDEELARMSSLPPSNLSDFSLALSRIRVHLFYVHKKVEDSAYYTGAARGKDDHYDVR